MELDREEILEALRRVALSKPNDAISLALQQLPEGQGDRKSTRLNSSHR